MVQGTHTEGPGEKVKWVILYVVEQLLFIDALDFEYTSETQQTNRNTCWPMLALKQASPAVWDGPFKLTKKKSIWGPDC